MFGHFYFVGGGSWSLCFKIRGQVNSNVLINAGLIWTSHHFDQLLYNGSIIGGQFVSVIVEEKNFVEVLRELRPANIRGEGRNVASLNYSVVSIDNVHWSPEGPFVPRGNTRILLPISEREPCKFVLINKRRRRVYFPTHEFSEKKNRASTRSWKITPAINHSTAAHLTGHPSYPASPGRYSGI